MKSARGWVLALVIPALILVVFAVTTVVASGPLGKVTVCHWASHKFVEITVNEHALPAHLAHGDVPLDEYGECP